MSYQPPEDPLGGSVPPPTGPTADPPPGGYPPAGVPQYGQPAPYGQGGYQMPRDHPQGTTILVLGILSIAVCAVLAPVAWVMGNNALKEIDANPGAYSNRSNVQIGRIIGMVYTILMIVGIVAFAGLMVLAAGSSSSSGY